MNRLLLALTLVLATFFTSCTPQGSAGSRKYASYDLPAYKPSNPRNVRVKVSTNAQMVYVMEGNKPLLVMPVSVGTNSTPTPKGNYTIYSKEAKRRAHTHGFFTRGDQCRPGYRRNKPAGWKFTGTPMPYWCEFKSGYGFHAGWLKHAPCTHGCIRMHENLAPKFFQLVREGTPLNIAYSQPEDKTIGRKIRRPIDASPLPDYPYEFKLSRKIFTKHKKPHLISTSS